jgi:hypothetical protein
MSNEGRKNPAAANMPVKLVFIRFCHKLLPKSRMFEIPTRAPSEVDYLLGFHLSQVQYMVFIVHPSPPPRGGHLDKFGYLSPQRGRVKKAARPRLIHREA